jgi:hypothetical protein
MLLHIICSTYKGGRSSKPSPCRVKVIAPKKTMANSAIKLAKNNGKAKMRAHSI